MTVMSEARVDVLVVDDDAETRGVCADILQTVGYAVETAGGGDEALVKAHHNPPRLIVCDLVMAPMDGSELIARLRADPLLTRVPVVLLSGRRDLPAISGDLAVAAHLASLSTSIR